MQDTCKAAKSMPIENSPRHHYWQACQGVIIKACQKTCQRSIIDSCWEHTGKDIACYAYQQTFWGTGIGIAIEAFET